MATDLRRDALEYHRLPHPGKIETIPTKPYDTPADLSLAYSPGVAYPCQEIAADKMRSFDYTNRGNLVGVVSNGTAVLGLGDIGAEASKPVMEGKAMLFKVFADIDAYDIELNARTTDELTAAVKALLPTFGAINLEDVKAPECFEVEDRVRALAEVPVMHDDQHGTAVVVAAAMLGALAVQGRHLSDVRIVVNGAGAAAIACTRLLVDMGASHDRIVMCDSHGVISYDRHDLNRYKEAFAIAAGSGLATLDDAIAGADVFLGLSVADVLTEEMVRKMAVKPVIFALANPNPEISPDAVKRARPDAVYATGRSDLPNQINNVLGFPYIFRGALDTRATEINQAMLEAAARAIAALARTPVPKRVMDLYGQPGLAFGRDYILPKPFDRRLISTVAPAVAKAAMDSGVARREIVDLEAYGRHLALRIKGQDALMEQLVRG